MARGEGLHGVVQPVLLSAGGAQGGVKHDVPEEAVEEAGSPSVLRAVDGRPVRLAGVEEVRPGRGGQGLQGQVGQDVAGERHPVPGQVAGPPPHLR